MASRRPSSFRPSFETLETRTTPAFLSSVSSIMNNLAHTVQTAVAQAQSTVVQVQSQSIGDRMVAYLDSMKGQRLGGGECAHLAEEALRVSGGKFILSGTTQDYVWSS